MAHSLRRLACVAAVLALLPSVAAAAIRQAPPAPAGAARAADPNPGVRNYLYGVKALSSTNAWTVGYYCASSCADPSAEVDRTLIEHWDGTAWTQVPSPDPGTQIDKLSSVTATSATDAWAVGYYCSTKCGRSGEVEQTLIAHWDGTSWSQVTSPNPFPDELTAVTATSPTSAWAVGYYCTAGCLAAGGSLGTLAEHWNGTAWSQVHTPSPGAKPKQDVFFGVGATGTGDAWAAGSYCTSACFTPSQTYHTLIEHWNGTVWSKVATPSSGTGPNLLALSADSPADAWAVGYLNGSKTVILHWTGTAWAKATSPNPGSTSLLYGLSAQSPTDAWAVGRYFKTSKGRFLTLILRWGGTAWQQVASPNLGSPAGLADDQLDQVSADSPTDAWAVGNYCSSHCAANSETDATLILHWNGTRWSVS